jgi:hypothetical protein
MTWSVFEQWSRGEPARPRLRPEPNVWRVPEGASPSRPGKARTAILLWLLGVPIPVIILIFLVKGCMGH